MNNKISLLLLGIVGVFAVGCSTNQAPINAPVVQQPETLETAMDNLPGTQNNSIFFDFNKYDIKPDNQQTINNNATYLSGNNQSMTKVEGNTDDIGSVEYNLSLGQKRADIVKKALIAGGASANQVEAVSNGKLKPIADNDTDEGRAFNRRSDILIMGATPSWYAVDEYGVPTIKQ